MRLKLFCESLFVFSWSSGLSWSLGCGFISHVSYYNSRVFTAGNLSPDQRTDGTGAPIQLLMAFPHSLLVNALNPWLWFESCGVTLISIVVGKLGEESSSCGTDPMRFQLRTVHQSGHEKLEEPRPIWLFQCSRVWWRLNPLGVCFHQLPLVS